MSSAWNLGEGRKEDERIGAGSRLPAPGGWTWGARFWSGGANVFFLVLFLLSARGVFLYMLVCGCWGCARGWELFLQRGGCAD
jgi:hypothetical protein